MVLAVFLGSVLAGTGVVAWRESRAGETASETLATQQSATPTAELSPPPAPSEPTDPSAHPTDASPSGIGDFADLYKSVRSGVVMIRATTCDGSGSGTGFLIEPGRVLTAAHVVDTAASVAVVHDGLTYKASVVGVDNDLDLAMLEVPRELDGYTFELAAENSSPVGSAGSAVAVVGHPLGEPLTITRGSISRVDETLWPNFQLDASVNPGNSGGPVVTSDGMVAGIVVSKDSEAEGLAYALRADVAVDLVSHPGDLDAPEMPSCANPLGPDSTELPELPRLDDLDSAVVATLANYFGGINRGDYELAYRQFSTRLQSTSSYVAFADGVSTSYDFEFDFHSVVETSSGAEVWLSFVSLQAPESGPSGEACTRWSLDYELVWVDDGVFAIDRVRGHDDGDGHTPCR